MKIKQTIMACLLSAVCLSASAQEPQAKTEYVFNPHWYVQVQPLGIQHTLGELDFGKLNSYNAQIGVGYNFSPVLGARLAVNAWQSKAGSEFDTRTFEWKWNYVAPMVDVTVNLSNLICGYNPTRVFNLGIFAGVGANIAFSNDEAQEANDAIAKYQEYTDGYQPLRYLWHGSKARIAGQAGVTADFRVSDAVSIGVEFNANTLSDHFNSKKAGNSDWYFNALAGVKVNLGKTYTTRTVVAEQAPVVEPQVVDKVVEKVVEKEVPAVVQPIRRDVFFTIRSTSITNAEKQKVREIAEYMKANPNSKVVVTGYADKGTGNARINRELSEHRAKVVAGMLVKDYNISASRIDIDFKGDTEQPYAENDLNRVTICIAQ